MRIVVAISSTAAEEEEESFTLARARKKEKRGTDSGFEGFARSSIQREKKAEEVETRGSLREGGPRNTDT